MSTPDMHLSGRIENGKHILPVRVYYEDTDAGGVVYHASYLRFCERGRTDFLRLLGVRHTGLTDDRGEPLYLVVKRMTCDFIRPARLDDILEVRTSPILARGALLEAEQEIFPVSDGLPQTGPIFRANVTVVVIDSRGRPRRLPAQLQHAFAAMMDAGNNPEGS
jgi:acyl-CoA thioester hydrolase